MLKLIDDDESGGHSKCASSGPLVTLMALARCDRLWTRIYAIATEDGEVLLHSFLQIRRHPPLEIQSHLEVTRLDLGPSINASNQKPLPKVGLSLQSF